MLLNALFSHIVKKGSLRLQIGKGSFSQYGDGSGPAIHVHVKNHRTALAIGLNPYLKLGEAYMNGALTIENATVFDFLSLLTRNLGAGDDSDPLLQKIQRGWRQSIRFAAQYNPARRAKRNVAHHYDLSNTLYRLFLDRGLNYSCAYFESPDDDLETAQNQKLRHIAAKLALKPGMRVLDIGCGWGSMALWLAHHCDVQVTGITLSTQQAQLAKDRVEQAGLSDRVSIHLQDYRAIEPAFDRIVSIGMFEHVGLPFYGAFFQKIHNLLTPDGVALIHHIARSQGPGATNPWMTKYIFPGGYSPALSEVLPHIERSGLMLTDLEILRHHYAETLRHWRQRFSKNRHKVATLLDERFCRMWEFYLAGSELSFRDGGHVVAQWQLCQNPHSLPYTRPYMETFEKDIPL
ncbi:cyclopropane-fatty-acyl-phospholipid synthase [Iodidimonas muriae]|uniref:Cyclopropane-fatty-acyl-phospholipid synthase n=1 Tax=Iodidimonas muriae TaxID=261467 RepID=A0ABQ2LEC0_9PROT|nr:cyclopropane-fatty-acyl-phospholipid synthase family protein [Iodidimonas muriae]GGO13213.1 cyclopropane-fatty-acyl-phospholipid synthase [Iodidimonas muriae]